MPKRKPPQTTKLRDIEVDELTDAQVLDALVEETPREILRLVRNGRRAIAGDEVVTIDCASSDFNIALRMVMAIKTGTLKANKVDEKGYLEQRAEETG